MKYVAIRTFELSKVTIKESAQFGAESCLAVCNNCRYRIKRYIPIGTSYGICVPYHIRAGNLKEVGK